MNTARPAWVLGIGLVLACPAMAQELESEAVSGPAATGDATPQAVPQEMGAQTAPSPLAVDEAATTSPASEPSAETAATPTATDSNEGLSSIPVAVPAREPLQNPIEPSLSRPKVEEVIVTAARRAQNIQDVVGGIQVVTGADLDAKAAAGMEDYLHDVPSVTLKESGAGSDNIGIRGVSNLSGSSAGVFDGSSTVGIYLNDVPVQGSGPSPDLALYDLNRVEVLKGPQGTLYGEGSMGGAIRMIVNSPTTDRFSVKTDVLGSMTDGGGFSGSAKAAINIPLYEAMNMAARLVGTYKRDGGWVEYEKLGESNANVNYGNSIRALLTGEFNEKAGFEVLYLGDHSSRRRYADINPDLSGYRNEYYEPVASSIDFNQYALTLKYDFDWAQLTSVSSYVDAAQDQVIRYPIFEQLLVKQGIPAGTSGINNEPYYFHLDQNTITQELRLVSTGENTIDTIFGLFLRTRTGNYRSTGYEPDLRAYAGTIATLDSGLPVTLADLRALLGPAALNQEPESQRVFTRDGEETYRQYAAYGEATWHVTEKFDSTLGLRLFYEKVGLYDDFTVYNELALAYAGATPTVISDFSAPTTAVLPKLALSYHINDDVMVFAQLSRGFRSGQPNSQYNYQVGKPIVDPDTVWNYEIGSKTLILGKTTTLNSSLYYIDWKDIQAFVTGVQKVGNLTADGVNLDNAGEARLYGAEMELLSRLSSSWTFSLNLGYVQSELTKVSPNLTAKSGQTLPNTQKLSLSTGLSYAFLLSNGWMLNSGVVYQYIDKQKSNFQDAQIPDGNPLAQFDSLSSSVALNGERWGLTLLGSNLLNQRQELFINQVDTRPNLTVGRPRTVSLQLHLEF